MLKLKLQYFGHLVRSVDSLENTLMLGEIGGRRRRGWQKMIRLDGITDSMDMSLGKLRELVMDRWPGVLWFMGLQRVRHDWVNELNWTELMIMQGGPQWVPHILPVFIPTSVMKPFSPVKEPGMIRWLSVSILVDCDWIPWWNCSSLEYQIPHIYRTQSCRDNTEFFFKRNWEEPFWNVLPDNQNLYLCH